MSTLREVARPYVRTIHYNLYSRLGLTAVNIAIRKQDKIGEKQCNFV